MKKRIISFLLVMALLLSMAPMVTIEAEAASGFDYTASNELAVVLDAIFSGDIDVFSNANCTNEVSMPINQSMSNSTTYYVKNKTTGSLISGKQCYIYANAVYNKLFNEPVVHGSSFKHSTVIISGGSNSVSYSMFVNAGVRCGAYLRTTTNSNGSYNGDYGHSLIVLSYNADEITYLEGNGDGAGLVRIASRTWAKFNELMLSGRSRYLCHVVQPTQEYYDGLYETYLSECKEYPCGMSLEITEECYPYTLPCNSTTAAEFGYTSIKLTDKKLKVGDFVTATALYKNSEDNYWYKVTLSDGTGAYLFSKPTMSGAMTLPWIDGGSFPSQITGSTLLKGTLKSHGVIETIQGQVMKGNDVWGTPVICSNKITVNQSSYNLKQSDVDYSLPFQDLSKYGEGYYTLTYDVSYHSYCADGNELSTVGLCTKVGQYYFYYGNNPGDAGDTTGGEVAETADFMHRSDGVWLWPLPKSAYNRFSDWAGCHGYSNCPFHDKYHSGWGDSAHTSNNLGHNGIDIGVSVGTEVYAAADGVLYCTSTDWSSRGITAIVEHPAGVDANGTSWSYYSIYQHLNSVVSSLDGKTVKAGDIIAYSGKTDGAGTGQAHLHFGIVLAPSGSGYAFSRNPNSGSENQLYWVESKGWILDAGYRTGRILPNPALNSPAGFPTGNSAVVPPLKAHAGSVMYTFDKNAVTIGKTEGCSHVYSTHVTLPTCTLGGYTTHTCSNCGDSYTDNYTAAAGHNYGAWETQTAATCLTDGVQKRTCSGCGDVQTQSVPAIGHDYVETTVDATCTQYGYIVYTCSHCGDSHETGSGYSEWSTTYPSGVDASRIESRTEYRYQTKNFTTAATNVLDGWIYYGTTTQLSGWSEWSEWSDTAVTASENVEVETREVWGYGYFLCRSCGAHMHGSDGCWTWAKDPATGKGGCGSTAGGNSWHTIWSTTSWEEANFKDWHGTGKVYAHVDGQLVFKWSKGEGKTQYRYRTRTQETVYQFYQWSDWSAWSATPVSANETTNVETRTVYRYALGELAAHSFGPWETIQAGSCVQASIQHRTCSHCGHYETQETPAPGHSYNAVVTAPTCTENGYTTYTCNVCGDSCVDNETPALDHAYEVTAVVEPTCNESGWREFVCSLCGDSYKEEIMSPPHVWTPHTVAPSCTAQGYTEYVCYRCGDSYVSDEVAPLDHSYESVVTEPTYTEQGYTTHTCSRCGDSYVDSYTAPLVPETDVKVIISSVTGKAGDTVEVILTLENAPELRSLAISDLVYDRENLTLVSGQWLKDGAMMSPWNNGKEEGALLFEANEDLNGEIFKLTFAIKEDATAGAYSVSCVLTAKQREESGRDMDVAVAVMAGQIEVVEYITGDVDGSEFVSTDDAIYLLYHIMFGEDYAVNQDCDFDGSGFVSTDDAIYLLYHIMFGEEDYPLH